MIDKPHVTDSPGLTWRPRKAGWEARWQCRSDLAARGYPIRTVRIFLASKSLTENNVIYIQQRCQELQGEMLAWSKQGVPVVASFDGTIGGLIGCFRGDKDSPYNKKIRHVTRQFYDQLFNSIMKVTWHDDYGHERKLWETRVAELKARTLLTIHGQYYDSGRIAMGHQVMSILRTLSGFGASVLEDNECARLCIVMGKMKFPQSRPRNEILTADMAALVRNKANERGLKSLALGQAFQFDGMLRQKDVIGEWVPLNEGRVPMTDIVDGGEKWIRGLRWESIDRNMMLRHITSKRQKEIVLNLRLMPMVMEELGHPVLRSQLPEKGPIIVYEVTGVPWRKSVYRKEWRRCADLAGIPKQVKNMDSRAGAITEATQSGAPLESIKHAATHSDISMTQRYARAAETKTEDVQRARMEYRNKSGS